MPRHTRPRPRLKHSRAHTKYQARRYALKRWRRAKRIYGDTFVLTYPPVGSSRPTPEETRQLQEVPWQEGPVFFVHPEAGKQLDPQLRAWPFDLPWNAYSRNTWNRCSCWMCSNRPEDRRSARRKAASEQRLLGRTEHVY